jgi:MipA family protein
MLTTTPRGPLLVALTLLLSSAPAVAEEPVWELGAGAAAFAWPAYPGSDQRTNWAIPYPYVIYRGDFVRADGDDVSGLLFNSDRLELDVSGSGTPRVRSDKVPARDGMPDVNFSFELGPSLRFLVLHGGRDHITAQLNLRGLASLDLPWLGYRGLLFNPTLAWERQLHPRADLGLNVNTRYADRRYHNYFYEVPDHLATAERPAYGARRGYNGTHLAMLFTYRATSNLRLRAVFGYRTLHGAAFLDSPLVQRSQAAYVNVLASYLFLRSNRTVESAEEDPHAQAAADD